MVAYHASRNICCAHELVFSIWSYDCLLIEHMLLVSGRTYPKIANEN